MFQDCMALCGSYVCGLCFSPQERRKEFEANLEKAGLELETEDRSVRNSATEYLHHLVDSNWDTSYSAEKKIKGMAQF